MVLNCMASRRLYAEKQGQSSHQDSVALPLASTARNMRKRGRSHGGRHSLALSLAVGLLRSSTSPAPACAFLLPGAVSRSRSVGLGSGSAIGISSGRSSFAGSTSCVVGAAQSSIRRRRSRTAGGAGGPLRMGIPKLFRWLTDQYPVISQRLDQGLNEVRPSFVTELVPGLCASTAFETRVRCWNMIQSPEVCWEAHGQPPTGAQQQ